MWLPGRLTKRNLTSRSRFHFFLSFFCSFTKRDLHKYNRFSIYSSQAEGQTALHIAAFEGDDAMIKFLQTARADANIADSVS